jgi:hypothetical protein
MKMMTDESYDRVKTPWQKKLWFVRRLSRCHSYDILANPEYAYDFSYISPAVKNRSKLIVDGDDDDSNNVDQSDLVRAILGLAYL